MLSSSWRSTALAFGVVGEILVGISCRIFDFVYLVDSELQMSSFTAIDSQVLGDAIAVQGKLW